jgi:[ribosomal protein S18]-alanine N-acetyltransferase
VDNTIVIRRYSNKDKSAVLNLFDLNTPQYFSPLEKKDLVHYLDFESEHYFIIELNQSISGCGGFNLTNNNKTGSLSWDMIHPEFHGRKLGGNLVKYRLHMLNQISTLESIIVRTSQFVFEFYEKMGFKLIEVFADYWAKGYHLYRMEYDRKRANVSSSDPT